VHINSSCTQDALECLSLVAGARARGLDVTTEAYPYTAGMTYINSALFNPGWREKLGIDYDALQLPGTGRTPDPGAVRSTPHITRAAQSAHLLEYSGNG